MAINLKEKVKEPERFHPGHRACAGCGGTIALRQMMRAAGENVVVGSATGCMEVISTIYPYTAWGCSFIHSAFENSAATISGVESAWRALKKKGKVKEDYQFIAMGGDGASYDIGLQAMSGAFERRHKMLYVCYNNGAYMNTGTQRSSATPIGANVTTAPAGKVHRGKEQFSKNLTEIMIAHSPDFAAQASPHNYKDLMEKVEKALSYDGPSFINIIASCNRGWRLKPDLAIQTCKDAVECCYWPLYEYENGKYKINYKPKTKMSVKEWMQPQGRFSHLMKPGNEDVIAAFQGETDRRWERLLTLAGE